MALQRRSSTVPLPDEDGPGSLRVVNPSRESRRATLVVHGDGDESTAHVVDLTGGQSAVVPLASESSATTVECHRDGAAGSAVFSIDADGPRPPMLSLRRSTVVVSN